MNFNLFKKKYCARCNFEINSSLFFDMSMKHRNGKVFCSACGQLVRLEELGVDEE